MEENYKLFLDKIKNNKKINNKKIKIGFIGGSITQGSLSSKPETCYAYNVYSWFCDRYPNVDFEFINAGIGGTSSHLGVARAERDLLKYQPDFVVVDFSVNDNQEKFYQETFESLLRKIMKCSSKPAICVLNNAFYDSGITTQVLHNEVCDYYNIPYASVKDTIYQRILKGELTIEEITPDNLHPNDYGHRLVADEVIKVIEKNLDMSLESLNNLCEKSFELPKPLTQNRYEYASIYTKNNIELKHEPKLEGFKIDKEEVKYFGDHFKNGWIASVVGDKIIFKMECSSLAIQFRKTIEQPSPIARVVIDGDLDNAVILDSNYEEKWGDCLFLETILHDSERKIRNIEIEIIKTTKEDKCPFYLLSLVVA